MRTCLLCLAALLLAACGASGALYLPGQPPKHEGPLKKNLHKTSAQPGSQPESQAPDADPATPGEAPDQTAPAPQP